MSHTHETTDARVVVGRAGQGRIAAGRGARSAFLSRTTEALRVVGDPTATSARDVPTVASGPGTLPGVDRMPFATVACRAGLRPVRTFVVLQLAFFAKEMLALDKVAPTPGQPYASVDFLSVGLPPLRCHGSTAAAVAAVQAGRQVCEQSPVRRSAAQAPESFNPRFRRPLPAETHHRLALPAQAELAIHASGPLGAHLGHGPPDNKGHQRPASDTPVLLVIWRNARCQSLPLSWFS